jgi:hypothetical protein
MCLGESIWIEAGGLLPIKLESRSAVLTTIALTTDPKPLWGPLFTPLKIGGDSNKYEGKFMRNGMQDTRGRAKREAEYYRSNPIQSCVVCGRKFIRRKDKVCSVDCLKKQETQKSDATE